MGRFDFLPTSISGLTLVQRKRYEDERGFLSRFYCAREFEMAGMRKAISQINHTLTHRAGAVRGMHYQTPPHAELKVVSCLHGEIFDVAVDLRQGSPTFLKWHAEVLSAKNQRSMLIPEGFAHGFQALGDDCEIIYLHTASYEQSAEAALNPLDSRLEIGWPMPITEMSVRDRNHPMVAADFEGVQQ